MPVDMTRYPPNWFTEIRPGILARAGEMRDNCGRIILQEARCERCGAINHSQVQRKGKAKLSTIVLTIAHLLDPDPMNCDPSNLLALCQRCHNTMDAPMRAEHAAITRSLKKEAQAQTAGQLPLFAPVRPANSVHNQSI